MNTKSNISGFILAGGLSTRMGSDKAMLMFENETLLGRMIRLIDPFCRNVAISGIKESYLPFKTEMIADVYSGIGPIAGIYSALKFSDTDWNLIVSVDVPFINEDFLEFLTANPGDFACVVPQHAFGIEPLIGIYHKQALPVIEKMINDQNYKLMNMLSKLNVCYLDCNFLIKKYPRLFMNLNRVEDFNSI